MGPRNHDEERRPLLDSNGNHDRDFPIISPQYQNQQQHKQNGHYNTTQQQNGHSDGSHQQEVKVEFEEDDPDCARNWPKWKKFLQVLQIFILAFICPMASSIFAPAVSEIAQSLGVDQDNMQLVLLGQTGFVCMLGIGPLFLAPMSETFGRRVLFLSCVGILAVLQVPTALVTNVPGWVVIRTLSGFFGSVGVANGGGSISDLFETQERAVVLGVYLVAPLLGPSIGPLIGGVIVGNASWRWIFGVTAVLSGVMTVVCYFFLDETLAPVILQQRKKRLEKESPKTMYIIPGSQKSTSILSKVKANSGRAIRILSTQPIVLIMSLYQALVFSTMYSLYAEYSKIWTAPPYNFSKTQLGLAYLGPAIGFIITAIFIVFFIDRLYQAQARYFDTKGQPEYRLPMANIGALFLPISLFWFGWTVQYSYPWPVPLAATLFFGASQVSIFNTVQTYYIDAYESSAASALAAGAFLRSVVGGIVPLFVGKMFEIIGYGWGMSVFGFLAVALMPAPVVFYFVGRRLRERFPFKG